MAITQMEGACDASADHQADMVFLVAQEEAVEEVHQALVPMGLEVIADRWALATIICRDDRRTILVVVRAVRAQEDLDSKDSQDNRRVVVVVGRRI